MLNPFWVLPLRKTLRKWSKDCLTNFILLICSFESWVQWTLAGISTGIWCHCVSGRGIQTSIWSNLDKEINWMLSKLDPVEIKMKTNKKYVANQLLSLSYCCVTNPSWARASLSINIMYILVALLIVLTVPIWSPGTSQVHLPSPLLIFKHSLT